jgi:nucleoid DNA-binding protein
MNKALLAKNLKKADVSYRTALLCIDVLLEAMSESLAKGEKIVLRGLGTIYVKKHAARITSLNGNMSIPEHGRIVFHPSEKLRKAVWDCRKAK